MSIDGERRRPDICAAQTRGEYDEMISSSTPPKFMQWQDYKQIGEEISQPDFRIRGASPAEKKRPTMRWLD
jgi:hypothetical protein